MLMVNYKPSALHGHEDTELKYFGGHELDLSDSAYVVSYWRSIVTMHLSCTVTEIWGSNYIGVTTLTFGVT